MIRSTCSDTVPGLVVVLLLLFIPLIDVGKADVLSVNAYVAWSQIGHAQWTLSLDDISFVVPCLSSKHPKVHAS